MEMTIKIEMEVLCTRMNVGDWGQSIVQFGGDDRTGICLCTDMAILDYYFRILKYYATFIEFTADISEELDL